MEEEDSARPHKRRPAASPAASRQEEHRLIHRINALSDEDKCNAILQRVGAACGAVVHEQFLELQREIARKFSEDYGKGAFKGARGVLGEKKWRFMLCVFEACAYGASARNAATIHINNPQNDLSLKEKREKRKPDSKDSPVKSSEDLLDELLQVIPDGHFCNLSPPTPCHTDNGPTPMNVLSASLPSLSRELEHRAMQNVLVVKATLHVFKDGHVDGPIPLLDPTTRSEEHRFRKFKSLLETKFDLLTLAIEQEQLWNVLIFYDLERFHLDDTAVQLRAKESLPGMPSDFLWDRDCSRFLWQFLPQNGTLLLFINMDSVDNFASFVSVDDFSPSSGSSEDGSLKDSSSGFGSSSGGGSPGAGLDPSLHDTSSGAGWLTMGGGRAGPMNADGVDSSAAETDASDVCSSEGESPIVDSPATDSPTPGCDLGDDLVARRATQPADMLDIVVAGQLQAAAPSADSRTEVPEEAKGSQVNMAVVPENGKFNTKTVDLSSTLSAGNEPGAVDVLAVRLQSCAVLETSWYVC